VVAIKNFTLRIQDDLLAKLRVYAARRNESMTTVINAAIRQIVSADEEREAAKRRILERLKNPPDLGTHGKLDWTCEELYDRGVR
jgi:predicted transcriptional regulator